MNKIIENYTLLEIIGSGQYGEVYKAIDHNNNNYVAIKMVSCQKFKEVPKLEEFTMNEIQTLSRIDNPNIIQFIEMLKTVNHYYFVYEYCNGGTLEDKMRQKKYFSEDEALPILRQIINAFRSLYSDNIIHRDVKPSNILFHNDVIKIADFGFCKQLNEQNELCLTSVGSPMYMSPEILLGNSYGINSEVWGVGCVVYEMLFGECPFEVSDFLRRGPSQDFCTESRTRR